MAQDPLCFRLGTVNELSSTGTAASLELGGALLLNVSLIRLEFHPCLSAQLLPH